MRIKELEENEEIKKRGEEDRRRSLHFASHFGIRLYVQYDHIHPIMKCASGGRVDPRTRVSVTRSKTSLAGALRFYNPFHSYWILGIVSFVNVIVFILNTF